MLPTTTRAGILLAFLASCVDARAACTGLRCVIKGKGLVWAREGWGELQLAVDESQTSARGTLVLAGSAAETNVAAELKWGQGETEVLVTWTADGVTYSGLVVLSDAARMLVHDSSGLIHELHAGYGGPTAATEAGPENTTDGGAPSPPSQALAALSAEGRSALGAHNSVIRLVLKDDEGLCMQENGTALQLGSCDGPGTTWEVVSGRTPALRGLRSPGTGQCVHRRCFRGGSNALRLADCGTCGTLRWELAAGRLSQDAVVSSPTGRPNTFCVTRGSEEDGLHAAPCGDSAIELRAVAVRLEMALSRGRYTTATRPSHRRYAIFTQTLHDRYAGAPRDGPARAHARPAR